ncbi:MAG: D-glucuronyl C5-epimerase family protein [Gaiellales bacterium]
MRRRAFLPLALVCALLAAAAPAHGATLAQNLSRVGVAPADRAEYLASVREARVLARRLGGSRRTALNAVVASATRMAGRSDFSPALARIVFREVGANVAYLEANPLPGSGTRVRMDGIVYESYAGKGLRIQPLGTFFAILEPGRQVAAEGGVAAAFDAALAVSLPDGDAYDLPYLLPYAGAAPPWESAMAKGVAAQAGLSAWGRQGDDRHLEAAIRFGNGALADAIAVEGDGLWFPLYVFKPGFRVLNGHLEGVIAMGRLADATGDDGFADAFARSAAATKAALPRYDTGGWGRYAPGQDSPVKYMTLMSSQLKELGQLTGDATFTAMGERFARDLKTAPVLRGPAKPLKAIRLKRVKRGAKPRVRLLVRRDKPVTLVLRVQTAKGRQAAVGPIRRSLRSGAGRITVTLPRKRGVYRIVASATDWAGNRVTGVRLATVRVR